MNEDKAKNPFIGHCPHCGTQFDRCLPEGRTTEHEIEEENDIFVLEAWLRQLVKDDRNKLKVVIIYPEGHTIETKDGYGNIIKGEPHAKN